MGFSTVIAIILVAILIVFTILYASNISLIENLLGGELVTEVVTKETTTTTTTSTTTTTTTSTTTTTVPTTTTTTTTLPVNETIAWLENKVHNLINAEREADGLQNLTWNPYIASTARKHSADMSENDYFDHTNFQGLNVSQRLKADDIYYWNLSAENILRDSLVKYYVLDFFGNVLRTEYKDLESFAKETVGGWMNSTGHRENIMNPKLNEAGVGIADNGNNTYYFTQNFITRTNCGYYRGECCPETEKYLPWCYVPYKCLDGFCR